MSKYLPACFFISFSFANESLFSPGCPPTSREAEKDLERLQGSAYYFLLNINLNFLTVFSQIPSVTSPWASGGWGLQPPDLVAPRDQMLRGLDW